ncbi:MAG: class B sortase [Bacilli bacterium]|nr:class B sortase [Bacilli bacterium]
MKKFKYLKVFFLVLMLIGLSGLLLWRDDNTRVKKIVSNVGDYLILDNDSYNIKEEIKDLNNDTVGWLKIDGTSINYPIVQGNDNKYYLTHDYSKKKNSAGWIFMDYRNSMKDQNIVIYGHHRKDGIMFGDVDKLMKKKFYDNNDGKILLVINDENIYYQIFSVYKAESNSNYNQRNYDDFSLMLEEFKNRSSIKFSSDLEGVEQIITLSTCHDNNKDRLVVHAYKLM